MVSNFLPYAVNITVLASALCSLKTLSFAMAIFYSRTNFLTKAKQHNAVHAAAYRRGTIMEDATNKVTYNYTRKDEVAATGIAYPSNVPLWFKAIKNLETVDATPAAFWNFVEDQTKRKDAQIAAETVIALPRELSIEQYIALAKEYATELTHDGFFVDWSLHNQGERGTGSHNPHLHVMTSLRPMVEAGFGPKRIPVLGEDGEPIKTFSAGRERIQYTEWAGEQARWREREKMLEMLINKHLMIAGIEAKVDCRSNEEKGNGLGRSTHLGQAVTAMQKKGENDLRAIAALEARKKETRERLQNNPELILANVIAQDAVFGDQDIYRAFKGHGFEDDDIKVLCQTVLSSKNVIQLEGKPSKYSTPDFIALEKSMIAGASQLHELGGHEVSEENVEAALSNYAFLSKEQKDAVLSLTKAGDLKTLVGLAGAGKSTLLAATNEAWIAEGLIVRGFALAGKAAEELEISSGIKSNTLASLLFGLTTGRTSLSPNEVVVLDEAGMIGSRDMEQLIGHVKAAGAKLVLVGDHKQLPPISAGAPFRSILDEVSFGQEVHTIRRQKNASHREASQHFANLDATEGLKVYKDEGAIHAAPSSETAIEKLSLAFVDDYLADKDVLALTYKNADVRALNARIRRQLKAKARLTQGVTLSITNGRGESFANDFSIGDRIVFLKNEKEFGVKNGTIATLLSVSGEKLVADVDGRQVEFDPRVYNHFAHGYAVTIHKSQGASVDHVHVLASELMDRNLTYVAMTRHKESVHLHYDETAFKHGLDKALGRARDKTSTRDYFAKEDIIQFGERRALKTKSLYARAKDFVCEKLKGVWTKKVLNIEKIKTQAAPAQPPEAAPAMQVVAVTKVEPAIELIEADQQDPIRWCVPPKTNFAEPVRVVVERYVREQETFKDHSKASYIALSEALGKDVADEQIRMLEDLIINDPTAFNLCAQALLLQIETDYQHPVEPKRSMIGVKASDQQTYETDPEVRQDSAKRSADKLSIAFQAWQDETSAALSSAEENETETRKIQSEGLAYPPGELGKNLRQAICLTNDDSPKLEAFGEWLRANPVCLEAAEKFEKNRLLLKLINEREPKVNRRLGILRADVVTRRSPLSLYLRKAKKELQKAPEIVRSAGMTCGF